MLDLNRIAQRRRCRQSHAPVVEADLRVAALSAVDNVNSRWVAKVAPAEETTIALRPCHNAVPASTAQVACTKSCTGERSNFHFKILFKYGWGNGNDCSQRHGGSERFREAS